MDDILLRATACLTHRSALSALLTPGLADGGLFALWPEALRLWGLVSR